MFYNALRTEKKKKHRITTEFGKRAYPRFRKIVIGHSGKSRNPEKASCPLHILGFGIAESEYIDTGLRITHLLYPLVDARIVSLSALS